LLKYEVGSFELIILGSTKIVPKYGGSSFLRTCFEAFLLTGSYSLDMVIPEEEVIVAAATVTNAATIQTV